MFLPPDAFDWALNAVLVRSGGKTILIDAGLGSDPDLHLPRAGQLVKRLEAAGIDIASVTDIVLTHMHMDHVGGLLVDGVKDRLRPDLQIHVAAAEVEFWEAPDFSRTAMPPGFPDALRAAAKRFNISPDVGYKWLRRWQAGDRELADRSRRPHAMPKRSAAAVETQVLAVRDQHPAWGARKIAHCLKRDGQTMPVPSTVHRILCRNGRVAPSQNAPPNPGHRFEKGAPNLLWQMDFKGHLPLANGTRCHPLTIVDDHSRYALCLKACADEQRLTVQDHLTATFRCYGLPEAFYTDNGSPWGDTSGVRWTGLKVWLLKLGVTVVHARPCHPQARGKNERFHRTLKAEVFAMRRFRTLAEVQRAFDAWRPVYNLERPHQGLDMHVPADRFRPSARAMPARVPNVEYDNGEIVRRVSSTRPYISFKGRFWKVPQAFARERLAIRPLDRDGHYGIFFASWQVASIDLTNGQPVSDVSEQVSAMSPV